MTYTWSLKFDTREPIYVTETETDVWLLRGRGAAEGWNGVFDEQMQTGIYRLDKQESPAVDHREIYSISCNKPSWERIYMCV